MSEDSGLVLAYLFNLNHRGKNIYIYISSDLTVSVASAISKLLPDCTLFKRHSSQEFVQGSVFLSSHDRMLNLRRICEPLKDNNPMITTKDGSCIDISCHRIRAGISYTY
ncbi:UNVERIFIED_CONTAM: hypothetical protein K2H54_054539 [Gekko kuhli]